MIIEAEIVEKSIIVAAHPDDEILWFSSILDGVDRVIICFLRYKTKHEKSEGRKKALRDYPQKNVSCLGLDESDAYWDADWQNPDITPFGLEIKNPSTGEDYRKNYYKLKMDLREKLENYRNVFTHNPWGEYGHVEHVQVYRAIKELQKEMGFAIWFSNYCSNKSYNLMLNYISGFNSEYVTLMTNKTLAHDIRDLYKKYECWSWYNDWEWFNEESFMRDKNCSDSLKTYELQKYGHIFPLNFIKVELIREQSKQPHMFYSLINRFLGRN